MSTGLPATRTAPTRPTGTCSASLGGPPTGWGRWPTCACPRDPEPNDACSLQSLVRSAHFQEN
jgi:hypothetical protein